MAKRSREQIREDEKRVIEELTKDARQTPNEIANKLGFSRQKAWRIIKRLEKTKEIWGYTTVIDEKKSNRNIYIALVKSRSPVIEQTDRLLKRIKNDELKKELDAEVIDMFFLHGLYDWILIFSTGNIQQATRFIGYMEQHYGESIDQMELLENIFSLIKAGKINPSIEKIKEFSVK